MTAYNAALAAVSQADYTSATWTTYQLVVSANVVTDQNSQSEVDAATLAITTAQGALVHIANMVAYNTALGAVVEADYTTASWSTYQVVVLANVVTDQDTQGAVDTATSNITAAQGALVHI